MNETNTILPKRQDFVTTRFSQDGSRIVGSATCREAFYTDVRHSLKDKKPQLFGMSMEGDPKRNDLTITDKAVGFYQDRPQDFEELWRRIVVASTVCLFPTPKIDPAVKISLTSPYEETKYGGAYKNYRRLWIMSEVPHWQDYPWATHLILGLMRYAVTMATDDATEEDRQIFLSGEGPDLSDRRKCYEWLNERREAFKMFSTVCHGARLKALFYALRYGKPRLLKVEELNKANIGSYGRDIQIYWDNFAGVYLAWRMMNPDSKEPFSYSDARSQVNGDQWPVEHPDDIGYDDDYDDEDNWDEDE